ncbi:MAG: ABC transporter substrate-binding protein [Saprospiraceae bacterium]
MISVPNHRLLLSGNNFLWILGLVFLGWSSCTPLKSTAKPKPGVQIITPDKTPKPETKTQPEKSTPTPSHATTKEVKISAVDTIHLIEKQESVPPITVKPKKTTKYTEGLNLKSKYHIKLLLPLESNRGLVGGNQQRFVHFYAGVLKALEVLDDRGYKFTIDVIDTQEGTYKVNANVSNILSDSTDLIIGPFERDDVKLISEEAKKKGIPVMSPWQTSTKITLENPWYIQLKPNLKEHFVKLAEVCSKEFNEGEVAIVGINNKETNAWINYFQESIKKKRGQSSKNFFTTYFVTNDSLINAPSAFYRLFSNPKIKAVLLPNYSFNDEDFVYQVLRKLMAEKGNNPLVVYGMPLLIESEKIDFDFYHALNMRIVTSDYIDLNTSEIREFRRQFLNIYGEIPLQDALKGYAVMMLAGESLTDYGTNFQSYIANKDISYLQTIFNIQKATSENFENDTTVRDALDYYENKHLDIIEFKGTGFVKRY